ncbi:MAG TPA: 50S ribosomal protein L25 [Anaerolineales bacterium]|nr:50S ribosomal protein L25 [Anaerolineales bacterium]
MESVVIKATKRTVTGKQVKQLRRAGLLPAVIYGAGYESTPISLEAHASSLLLPKLTASSLISIELDGKTIPVLMRQTQKNYIRNEYTHIDFLALDLKQKITAIVVLHLVGVAPAVKDYQAAILQQLESIEVEALPTDLPESISVDVSSLLNIGDSIMVKDLNIDENVSVLTDLDEIVAVATSTFVAESDEELGSEPEVIERGKKQEEV